MDTTAHAVLRDRRHWRGERRGLAMDRDGDLWLARVPAPMDGKTIGITATYPYRREVSGLALGPCNAVFVAATADNRVLFVDGLCQAQAWLPPLSEPLIDAPGHFKQPRGLAVTPEALWVADCGNARVQGLALPRLEANVGWSMFAEPTSLAVDTQARVLVVDAATRTVHRVLRNGNPDVRFDTTLASQRSLPRPCFVATGANDSVWVSDAGADAVFAFDADGHFMCTLDGPESWLPGALATSGARVYVADAATGAICMFEDGSFQGAVSGWHGPVTALAANGSGDLFIKPGFDSTYYRFAANAAYLPQGELRAGPFDAGEARTWERAWVEAEVPETTFLEVEVGLGSAAVATPDWQVLPTMDALLATVAGAGYRYAWLRLRLRSTSPLISPRLRQARCATGAEDYLDYLPLTYRQNDGVNGFLSRWLKLLRGEFDQVEELLDDMPHVADAQFAPASALPWLSQWLAFELPQIADDDERRALAVRAVQLFARRGTKQSLAEFVELHTGIRPALVEAFTERRVWMLGVSSQLGFDTRLAPVDPLGMVVPDLAGDDDCPGRIGRAVVGESGPLATYQIGVPLFADAAYRFCVVVDSYRLQNAGLMSELRRIIDREKPAHTDYRVEVVPPELCVGLQARVGIDAIVGGQAPAGRLGDAQLGFDTRLGPTDAARVGDAALDGTLTLT